MNDRYFHETPLDVATASLTGQEAQHLAKVMRAKPGDRVTLFDGSGVEAHAVVTAVARSEVTLEVVERREVDRESPVAIVLGVALPKGDRQRWLVEKLTELGVKQVVPLETTRGVSQPVDKARAKLARYVIEASKQCRRNRLMEIAPPMSLRDFVTAAPAEALRLIAHPVADASNSASREVGAICESREVWAAIGPEGGFTDEEAAETLDSGWSSLDLGRRILRIETAAAAVAALASLGREATIRP